MILQIDLDKIRYIGPHTTMALKKEDSINKSLRPLWHWRGPKNTRMHQKRMKRGLSRRDEP